MARGRKPKVIGIYGIPGSGKSHLLNQLRETFGDKPFSLFDSSVKINSIVPGGLAAFKTLPDSEKTKYREEALTSIQQVCKKTRTTGLIAGHLLFWENLNDKEPERVNTEKDWSIYTHIVYLKIQPEKLVRQRKEDSKKTRPDLPKERLQEWQARELEQLRETCRSKGVLFTVINSESLPITKTGFNKATELLHDFRIHNEEYNMATVKGEVSKIISVQSQLQTVLLLDAYRTLGPHDTGEEFWKNVEPRLRPEPNPLKTLFKSQGYSYSSFRQATLLNEEVATGAICDHVASNVHMYDEMVSLLKRAKEESHVEAIVVTCGMRYVWERVLDREGLGHVKVIGGGRISDGYVVTDFIKAHIVNMLHAKKLRVYAFGDSPLDMKMFQKADKAYVIVGEQGARSSTMDQALTEAFETNPQLSACQILLPKNVIPRRRLPIVALENSELDSIFECRINFRHATDKNAAKLLMTPMRDADISGHDLRKAHELVGYYLAMEFMSELVGIETYPTKHVQGNTMDGYRFRDEENTLIVPLMRGGEPMAFGVSKAFKLASFAHAKAPNDITDKPELLKDKRTVILVDSVVNTGKSIVEFVEPLRKQYPDLQIIVVAGVVQSQSVSTGAFADMLKFDSRLSLVALRVSENKYKGKNSTDTGHRLFNTTYLD